MLHHLFNFKSIFGPFLQIAQEAVAFVDSANNATDSNLDAFAKKEARKLCVQHGLNIGIPVAAAIVAGIAFEGVAALPAGVAAQALVKETGISKLLGEFLNPIIYPITYVGEFLKNKSKKYLNLDLTRLIRKGLNLVKPFFNMQKTSSSFSLQDAMGLFNLIPIKKLASAVSGKSTLLSHFVTGISGIIGGLFSRNHTKPVIFNKFHKKSSTLLPKPAHSVKKQKLIKN